MNESDELLWEWWRVCGPFAGELGRRTEAYFKRRLDQIDARTDPPVMHEEVRPARLAQEIDSIPAVLRRPNAPTPQRPNHPITQKVKQNGAHATRTCPVCEKPFTPKSSTQKTCSRNCGCRLGGLKSGQVRAKPESSSLATEPTSEESKACKKCGIVKPLGEFNRHPQTRDRHDNRCKACVLHYKKTGQYRSATPPAPSTNTNETSLDKCRTEMIWTMHHPLTGADIEMLAEEHCLSVQDVLNLAKQDHIAVVERIGVAS